MELIRKIISVYKFVRNTEGRIFSVRFKTADGRERVMNVKTLKKPRFTRLSYVVLENNLRQRGVAPDIRSFRADRVISLKCDGKVVSFN